MTTAKNIADLRVHLFAQLERLGDITQPVDVVRARLFVETAQVIINSAKVEVQAAAVLEGALSMPFIEAQADERSNPENGLAQAKVDPGTSGRVPNKDPNAALLGSGPSPDHPWRGNVLRHRLR